MKTGDAEAYQRLPIHYRTMLDYLNDLIVFSNMNMQTGDHQIIAAREDIDEVEMYENEHFASYQQLQQYKRFGHDPHGLNDQKTSWDLDKYKFVPTLEKCWEYRQNANWYIFVEADTAIYWNNMRNFLNILKPEGPLHIWSSTYLAIEMAYDGTGCVILGAAMKKAAGNKHDIQRLYEIEVKKFCYGGRMPAKISFDEGIKLTTTWLVING